MTMNLMNALGVPRRSQERRHLCDMRLIVEIVEFPPLFAGLQLRPARVDTRGVPFCNRSGLEFCENRAFY
jgi:hypothetical protein